MILLLDIGNSRIKWAMWNGKALKPGKPIEHQGEPVTALRHLKLQRADAVWISHVTGSRHERALARAVKARWSVSAQFARSQKRCGGLHNAYRVPQRLGVDRWLALLGAWKRYGSALCVADAGTALTVDVVDAAGHHRGGFIAPGLLTALQAVLGATRFTTRKLGAKFSAGLGRDTEACVRQGAYLGCLGAIDRASQTADVHAKRIITGGDAGLLLAQLSDDWEHRPHLVLEGLLALALDSH